MERIECRGGGFKGERDMIENSSRVKIIGEESKFEFTLLCENNREERVECDELNFFL